MMNNPVQLLFKTYMFMLLRFILCVILLYPAYRSLDWGINLGHRISRTNLFIADLLYAYIGFVICFFYIEIVRKYMFHLIRYSHVASMTALLTGERNSAGVSFGLSRMFSRFGAVNAIYITDKIMHKAVSEISGWLIDKAEIVPDRFKKGFIFRWVSQSVSVVVYHVLEAIASYLYSNPDKKMWEGAIKGTTLYVQSWKEVFKSSFVSSLVVKVLGKVVYTIVFFVLLYYFWDSGILTMLSVYITFRITCVLVRLSVVEPYESASMLVAFHRGIDSLDVDEEITEDLSDISSGFQDLILRGSSAGDSYSRSIVDRITSRIPLEHLSGANGLPEWAKNLFRGRSA